MTALPGCRSESLLGYLKALGVLRLIGLQADQSARGSWDGAAFELHSILSEDAIARFFLESYAPTPILNPWNSGAGFDGKNDAAAETLRRVAQTIAARWQPYRSALASISERYIDSGLRTQKYRLDAKEAKERDKQGFIRDLRAHCQESMLPWLDAAILLTPDDVGFPYLFGSGGNDGRLDFSVNFAARALDACGDQPVAQTRQLLFDALYDTAQGKLMQNVAIGQFSPRHAGGANATNGFDAVSLVNPWDYVLMLEGALLFAGSIGRRTDRAPGRPLFPFALRSITGGYGSATINEQTRGELWLPVWEGRASLASIANLLRNGRIDMPDAGGRSVVRSAALASEAVTAVVTRGVSLGIRRLERTVFAQRNGLAFAATSVGSVRVGERFDQGLALISRDAASWIERVRRLKNLGANARDAMEEFYGGLFAFPNLSSDRRLRARARQDLLVALANVDRALARARNPELPKMPRLQPGVVASLDDETAEHRTALAIASLAAGVRRRNGPVIDREAEELRCAGDNAAEMVGDLLERRMRLDNKDPGAGWLRASCSVSAGDAATFLTASFERNRFIRLLRAYWHIQLAPANQGAIPYDETIPAAYAVLKVVFDNPRARDERIARLLRNGDSARGLRLAVQRARTIRDFPTPLEAGQQGPRDVSSIMLDDAPWIAAALLLPIERSAEEYLKLMNAALVHRIPWAERGLMTSYLATIS